MRDNELEDSAPPDRTTAAWPRCHLDSIDASDLSAIDRLFTDPAVRLFLGGPIATELAKQRTTDVLSQAVRAWAIRPGRADHGSPLLGIVLLDRYHDSDDLEVSFLLLPEHWGKGYGRAATGQALACAFETLELSRVLAETQSRNSAAVRLLERLGFQLLRRVVRFGAQQRVYGVDVKSFREAVGKRP